MLGSVRLVLITDRAAMRVADPRAFGAAIGRALTGAPGGTVAIQVREKDLGGADLVAYSRAALDVARRCGAPVSINDRLDVALALGADGVHLPETGLPVAVARAVADQRGRRDLWIGASRHRIEDARAAFAEGATWVQLGPIWATPSKANLGAPLGVAALGASAAGAIVAVGGIDDNRARAAIAAGARAVAVIRAVWTAADPADAVAALLATTAAGSSAPLE